VRRAVYPPRRTGSRAKIRKSNAIGEETHWGVYATREQAPGSERSVPFAAIWGVAFCASGEQADAAAPKPPALLSRRPLASPPVMARLSGPPPQARAMLAGLESRAEERRAMARWRNLLEVVA
jgi:hypothetical protein